jgi:hypothetical protein
MMTLDGFFSGVNVEPDWHIVDEEFHRFAVEQLSEAGLLLCGNTLFKSRKERQALKLTESRKFNSGCVLLYYQPQSSN